MPRTISKIVYTFKELLDLNEEGTVTPKAVERARSWLQEAATDFDWHSCVLDFWEHALDQIGFENAKISFSGFWSQGDGASFTATVDLDKLVAFLSDTIEPKKSVEVVEGKEQFPPYIAHLIGKKPTNRKYRRLLAVREHIQDLAVENLGADTFLLMPIDQETFALALEDWAIWRRWETAFQLGKTTQETHPALLEDKSRHEELKRLLKGRLGDCLRWASG